MKRGWQLSAMHPEAETPSMSRIVLFRTLTLTLSLLSCMQQVWATERPNIIVIFTDDHGYADLSCQKVLPDVRTHNIDG